MSTKNDDNILPDISFYRSGRLVRIMEKCCGTALFKTYSRKEQVWIPTSHLHRKEKHIILEKNLTDVCSFQLLFLGVSEGPPLSLRFITGFEADLMRNSNLEKIPFGNPFPYVGLLHPKILQQPVQRKDGVFRFDGFPIK